MKGRPGITFFCSGLAVSLASKQLRNCCKVIFPVCSFIFRGAPRSPKPRNVVSPLRTPSGSASEQCCNAVSWEGKNATTEWNYGRNYCIRDRKECARDGLKRSICSQWFEMTNSGWPMLHVAAGPWHPGSRRETWNSKFTWRKSTFEFDAFEKKTEKTENKPNMTSGIRSIRRLWASLAARMGGSEECRGALQRGRWRAERRWIPARHGEVDLAAKPRVMCLHLNEKARKERETGEGRERSTGWAKRLGTLPSRDTWGMHQRQQLSLRSNTITVSAIWVRKTALLV